MPSTTIEYAEDRYTIGLPGVPGGPIQVLIMTAEQVHQHAKQVYELLQVIDQIETRPGEPFNWTPPGQEGDDADDDY